MRLLFAGTPEFAAVALSALLARGHDIPLVLTQPDRPAGRGQKPAQSDVKRVALGNGLAVFQPTSLKDPEAQGILMSQDAEVMVVAAYGLILPPPVLQLFPQGCINIHASLLPRWRGAAPIQRAILAGDRDTGVCIMAMEEGLDTGPVILKESIPITQQDTTATLHDQLAPLGARLICQAIEQLATHSAQYQPQPEQGATYARKITKDEARVQWGKSAEIIEREIRAFNPVPICSTMLEGTNLRLWGATAQNLEENRAMPGTILRVDDDGIHVQCCPGVLRLTKLQRAGGNPQPVNEFLRGHRLSPGVVLG